MHNILIIGAGQLGSRHLQGAVQSKLALNISVVDPSIDSLEVAESRANEISFGNAKTSIQFNQKVEVGTVIDVCIIATTANVRFKVFQELVSQCTVKNVLFEKVLFQKEAEYLDVEKLLSTHNIKAWVNCPRRIYPAYQKIKSILMNESRIAMSVKGSNWGMACNSIHFIDLFSFITQNSVLELDHSLLDDKVMVSKRKGHYEVFGGILGRDVSGNKFELYCTNNQDNNVHIEVELVSPNYEIIIKETKGELTITHNGEEIKETYQPLYQSQLTHLNIEEILEQGQSSLTSFSVSKDIHLPFIHSIKQHLENSLNKQLDTCPIT